MRQRGRGHGSAVRVREKSEEAQKEKKHTYMCCVVLCCEGKVKSNNNTSY